MKISEATAYTPQARVLLQETQGKSRWYSPITKLHFPVPRHGTQELASGTKKNIEELSGVKL